jgi:WD40 repeat protein
MKLDKKFDKHESMVTSVDLSADSSLLASGSSDRTVKILSRVDKE